MAGLLQPSSILTRLIRGANALMFRALNAVVTIGRDTEAHAVALQGNDARQDLLHSELGNAGRRACGRSGRTIPIAARSARFVVGLSGNLGFTHDPVIVFDAAARLLQDDPDIHFLLSGWGIGFERLKALQSEAPLPNVTLVERVPEEDLEEFLVRRRCLADSLSQECRRRIGAEPVLQSSRGRPARHHRFRARCRGGIDRARSMTWAGWSRPASRTSLRERDTRGVLCPRICRGPIGPPPSRRISVSRAPWRVIPNWFKGLRER